MQSIGRMRDRVTIQKETPAEDQAGGATTTWTDVDTVWANVSPISASTRIQTLAQAMSITHKITIRYLSYLDMPGQNRYRIAYRGQYLRISGITNPDGIRRFQEIVGDLGQMVGQ